MKPSEPTLNHHPEYRGYPPGAGLWSVSYANEDGESVVVPLMHEDEALALVAELKGCESCRTRGPVEPVEMEFRTVWFCGECREMHYRVEELGEALYEQRAGGG